MGKSLPDDKIDRIVEASSFKFMKENKITNPDAAYDKDVYSTNEKSFMRKGKAHGACLCSLILFPIRLIFHISLPFVFGPLSK